MSARGVEESDWDEEVWQAGDEASQLGHQADEAARAIRFDRRAAASTHDAAAIARLVAANERRRAREARDGGQVSAASQEIDLDMVAASREQVVLANELQLVKAARDGNKVLIRSLLELQENKPNVNSVCPQVGYSPLMAAADRGHIEILKMLLEAKANPSQVSYRRKVNRKAVPPQRVEVKMTPLLSIIRAKHAAITEIAEQLLQAKANVHETNHLGRCALFESVCAQQAGSVELLIKHKANMHRRHESESSPYEIAAKHNMAKIIGIFNAEGGGGEPAEITKGL
jgi:hypothetical protein